ncbi:Hsp20/alpha crystallin family protein [Spirosoma rhododendri]|uniref:Hsp20/alpha crystallin family protein n=1 Tax=Spirosoma rhododendri TaxID=2728024 RepID=A0A7L5DUB9_9BACT|nr:Hsp20/alpha crystallin family protein [Spirosoma rhododendri]QJD80923.1 Hsp20/alpha crystallin family protein [Spirosoma rhododendri]
MYNKQGFQSEHKGGCGQMGRGRFGGQWGRGKFGKFWGGRMGMFGQPPINIEETDAAFTISLYAAGLDKSKVTMAVKNDVLTIAYPGAESDNQEPTDTGYTYQEFSPRGFERQFQLNGKVLIDQISATYTDGVLKATLPKNPETNKPAQTITVG